MKPKLIVRLGALLAVGALAVYVLAQPGAPDATSQLDDAVALLALGKPQEAKALLATIDAGDPAYEAAKRYSALCSYELKDYLGFLKAVESFEVSAPVVPAEIREELGYARIDALFRYRKFEDIFPKIQAFRTAHPDSARLDAVTEYQLAALYERGMKKTLEAVKTQDTNRFNARWTEGRANLEEFLLLAASFPATNYSLFPKRNFKEDLWVARMTLGGGEAALEEIPMQDAAAREKFSLLRAQLYPKIQPEQIDQNLQRLADFINQFPASKSRPRIEYDMVRLRFRAGEQLCKEALAAEQAGEAKIAADKRAAARRYFELARPGQSRAVVDKAAGVEASDICDLREDLLRSYYWERDYATLAAQAASQVATATPGDLDWARGKVFHGIALSSQTPPKLSEAAAVLDEVLALGFNNDSEHNEAVIAAAKWRSYVAFTSGDKAEAEEIVEWVQGGNCAKHLKADFLKVYNSVAEQVGK